MDAAQAALVQVIITNRQFKDRSGMQKDLLQSCLRPVLKNLTHIQKLSLPLLQGLSRLLYLLSSWFNVTLGDKLFGYLKQWAEPSKLQSLPEPKASTRAVAGGEDGGDGGGGVALSASLDGRATIPRGHRGLSRSAAAAWVCSIAFRGGL